MSITKLIRYEVGRGEGRSSLFFDSGLLSLVISDSYGRVNPPPSLFSTALAERRSQGVPHPITA
jgi:hypothetical protein